MSNLLYSDLTYKIRGAIFKVYHFWGPGLYEQVYEESLVLELRRMGLRVERQVAVDLVYEGTPLSCAFRLDLLVEGAIVLELKAVEVLLPLHYKQLVTYLRVANKRLGLLVNFCVDDIADGIHRIAN